MRKGSIRTVNKPIISLKNLSEKGLIVIPKPDYKSMDPPPNSWVMIKAGDVIVSNSGTIRLVLKKNWQEGEVESLRATWEQHDERLEASLEVEKMEIDSSNFDYLETALRPNTSSEGTPHEYKPEYFTRAVRYNILTFLGFGKIGNTLHGLMPQRDEKRPPKEFALLFLLDSANNILLDVYQAALAGEKARTRKMNTIEIGVSWKKHDKLGNYQISDLNYPPGVAAATLETVTLASEIANALSLANEIHNRQRR